MLKKLWNGAKRVYGRMSKPAKALVVGGGAALVMERAAQAQVVLPDTGVTISDYVTAVVTGLGAVLGTVIAAKFSFQIVKTGFAWIRGIR